MKLFKTYIPLLLLLFSLTAVNQVAAQTVTFSFTNAQVISGGSTGTQLQFDIEMRSDVPTTFHSRGQIYFDYSSAGFGNLVVGNNKIQVEKLDLLSGEFTGVDKYQIITIQDNADTRVAITWLTSFQLFPPNVLFHNLVPSTATPLVRITMDIADPNETAGIDFVPGNMNGQTFYLTGPNVEIPYTDPSGYDNNLNTVSLPVELIDFEATKVEEQAVDLTWTTTAEVNNDKFVIEKRLQTEEEFEAIGEIKGAGTVSTAQSYEFRDNGLMTRKVFYRLKQIDFNGAFEYSEVLEVEFSFPGQKRYLLYPNPAKDIVTIESLDDVEEAHSFEITDARGKLLMKGEIEAGKGLERVDISKLADGYYFVKVKDKKGVPTTIKLTKD